MGIYIKGMEMPKNCHSCPMCLMRFCQARDRELSEQETRPNAKCPEDCPLVHVPEPHGRLGDLDVLPWYLANTSVKYATYEDWEMLCDAIAAAPTVIPASEEGET